MARIVKMITVTVALRKRFGNQVMYYNDKLAIISLLSYQEN